MTRKQTVLHHGDKVRKALNQYRKSHGNLTLEQCVYRLVTHGLERSGDLKNYPPFSK